MSSFMEKIIAAGLLLCMVVFWMFLAPASMHKRQAQAIVAPAEETLAIPRPAATPVAQTGRTPAQRAYTKRKSQIERLSRRTGDTSQRPRQWPEPSPDFEPPTRHGGDPRDLPRLDEIRDLPVNY